MTRTRRIVAVIAALIGTGAVVGALSGGVALILAGMLATPVRMLSVDALGFWALVGGFLGAPVGAAVLPALAWLVFSPLMLRLCERHRLEA